jgi:hypothetical protein
MNYNDTQLKEDTLMKHFIPFVLQMQNPVHQ